jgi:hypothetical protein
LELGIQVWSVNLCATAYIINQCNSVTTEVEKYPSVEAVARKWLVETVID